MATKTTRSERRRALQTSGRRLKLRVGTFSCVGHRGDYDALLELVRHRSRWTPTCHVWEGAKTKTGHPAVYIDGKQYRLWRLLAEVGVGHTNRVVSTCGRKDCVNLEHLGVYELRDGRDS